MKTAVTLGIDVGGTNTTLGLVDDSGSCVQEETFPTQSQESFPLFFARLSERIDQVIARYANDHNLIGIGAAAPAGNYYRGTIEAPSNFCWGNVAFVKTMQERYRLPVALTNDANAAALGEMRYGEARGLQHFAVITLGTGVGSGLVVNGELVYGHDGLAGELGHTIVMPQGRACTCGRRGCLETYASARGICRTVCELLAVRLEGSELRQIGFQELTAERIHASALRGDALALAAFEYTGEILGRALADAVAYLSPQAIIVFGGLAKAGEVLFAPLRRHFQENLLAAYRGKVKILPSRKLGCSTAVLGACVLIQRELEKRQPA
ncbi:MAG: Glucokinase [bacterium]|nr:Glucokinase [bacterium]